MTQYADESPRGIVVAAGEHGVVSYANASFRRFAGAEDRPVLGSRFFDAFPLLGSEHVRNAIACALNNGEVQATEIRIRSVPETPLNNAALVAGRAGDRASRRGDRFRTQ
jgi:PAS domain-containing protein